MTSTFESVGAGDSAADIDPSVLATAEFRSAIADLGHPTPAAELRFVPLSGGWCLTATIPPEVPWRVTELALVRALDEVRSAHPDVRIASRRFEPLDAAGELPALSPTGG